ncbi:MAG: hypothetical protein JWM80_1538 [Cyanobacteria bacterium RYN_339]|nr:hypothetical protein [Cyanobacteria bacterium RYN_339]
MHPRHWAVVIGVIAVGVTSCWVAMPGRVGATSVPLATLDLPDLDGDGKAERLHVDPDPNGNGHAMVRLDATRGKFTHEVMGMKAGATLAVTGARPRWHLAEADGKAGADIRLIERDGQEPELVVVADGQGKRYRYVEKGFMKLDAGTVIPGYSVGMVVVGDDAQAMGVLGDKAVTTGAWTPAAPPNARFELKAGPDGNVLSIVYDSQALVATNGVRPGVDEQTLAKHFPGRRDGDRWISARYGMRAVLDARGRAFVLELARPWKDVPGDALLNP